MSEANIYVRTETYDKKLNMINSYDYAPNLDFNKVIIEVEVFGNYKRSEDLIKNKILNRFSSLIYSVYPANIDFKVLKTLNRRENGKVKIIKVLRENY